MKNDNTEDKALNKTDVSSSFYKKQGSRKLNRVGKKIKIK